MTSILSSRAEIVGERGQLAAHEIEHALAARDQRVHVDGHVVPPNRLVNSL